MRKLGILTTSALLLATAIFPAVAGATPVPKYAANLQLQEAGTKLIGSTADLTAALNEISPVKYRVLAVADSEGLDRTAYLDQVAEAWGQPAPDTLLLVVFTGENHDIRFYMGADFRKAGVTVAEMTDLIHTNYLPRKRTGDPAGALADLIRAVNQRMGADSVAEQIKAALSKLDLAQLGNTQEISVPDKAVGCAVARQGATPVLACEWGPGFNAMFDGRALFWQENGAWKSQPYPEAGVRGVAQFQQAYQDGNELLVVLNVADGMTAMNQQVQLLRKTESGWSLVWAPTEAEWPKGHAEVKFGPGDVGLFTVETDSYLESDLFAESNAGNHVQFRDNWLREGDRYYRLSRYEVPTEYGTIVHFVTALVQGDRAEAGKYAAAPAVVEAAEAAGIVKSADRGFVVESLGGGVYKLITNVYAGTPQWLLTVRTEGEGFLVSEVK